MNRRPKTLLVGLLLAGLATSFYLAFRSQSCSQPPDDGDHNGGYQISHAALTSLLQQKFPNAQLMLLDEQYYYTSRDEWTKIFEDVLSNMPERTDTFDCENFAFLTIARVNERYHLNTCAFVLGMGWSHSFCVFVADNGIHTLDPETREIDMLNVVDFLIMG